MKWTDFKDAQIVVMHPSGKVEAINRENWRDGDVICDQLGRPLRRPKSHG